MLFLMILGGVYLFFVTWVFYLAIMNIKDNVGELTLVAKIIAYPVIVLGIICDVFFNFTVGSVLFLELPREWLFSPRLERHLHHSTGYRRNLAEWFCRNLLDPFDPSGSHCRRPA